MTQAQQDTWNDLLADQARDAQIAQSVFERLVAGEHIDDIETEAVEAAAMWLDVELMMRSL